jgi:hypothetical protein
MPVYSGALRLARNPTTHCERPYIFWQVPDPPISQLNPEWLNERLRKGQLARTPIFKPPLVWQEDALL